jgi:tetratricopeptide (TPR) repeat protein
VNYQESENYREDREIDEAVHRYEEMLRKGATRYFDVFQIEQIVERYIDEGKIYPAFEAVDLGITQHPESIALKAKKVSILFNMGEIARALKMANDLLKIEKNNVELLLLKGSSLLMLEKQHEAEMAYSEALKCSDSDDRDETLFNIGYSYQQNNLFKKAIRYFNEVILDNPMHEAALYELAFCYEQIDQNEKSAEVYNKYIDIDTFSDSAWFNLGIVYTKLERIEESIEAYEYALTINEDFPNAWFNHAHSLMLLKKYEQAIESFNAYLKYDDQSDEVFTLIANCYTRLRNRDASILHYRQAVAVNEKNDRAWYGCALELFGAKKYRHAYNCILKAVKYSDVIFDYFLLYAKIAAKLKYYNIAIDAYEKTINLDNSKRSVYLSYAAFLFKAGMVVLAINTLERALETFSSDSLIMYRLAAYNLDAGDEKSAAFYLKKAMNSDSAKTIYLFKVYPEAMSFKSIARIINNYQNRVKYN